MGNLDAVRDWGYAPEYVEGMWRMLQHKEPQDYVLATSSAFQRQGLRADGVRARRLAVGEVRRARRALRAATEGDALIGDYSEAKDLLGWEPQVRTPELDKIMVDADIKLLDDERSGRHVRADN